MNRAGEKFINRSTNESRLIVQLWPVRARVPRSVVTCKEGAAASPSNQTKFTEGRGIAACLDDVVERMHVHNPQARSQTTASSPCQHCSTRLWTTAQVVRKQS